jgi:hypothetical protein
MERPSPGALFASRQRSCCYSSVSVLEDTGLNLRTVAMKPQNCEEQKNLGLSDVLGACASCDLLLCK